MLPLCSPLLELPSPLPCYTSSYGGNHVSPLQVVLWKYHSSMINIFYPTRLLVTTIDVANHANLIAQMKFLSKLTSNPLL